ncbi:MAG: DNA-binding domain-containing protein, partial [Pseudomonadota bacterium]
MKQPPTHEFDRVQRAFTDYVRDPESNATGEHHLAGIEPRRLEVYKDLLFNNLHSFTRTAFPVAYSIMGNEWWSQAVRVFLQEHRCHSPYFNEIAGEFLGFLRERQQPIGHPPDFLPELMHYEWVELALDNVPTDTNKLAATLSDDLVSGKPVISPAAWLLSYEYPVYEITVDNQPSPEQKKPTIVLVFRKPDLSIGFRLLTPVFAMLWQALLDTEIKSGKEAIAAVAKQLQVECNPQFVNHASDALTELMQWGAILGAE